MSTSVYHNGISHPTLFDRLLTKGVSALGRPGTFDSYLFKRKYGFPPPPAGSDWSTQQLLDTIMELGCFSLPGDVVEIGAFLGGGTYLLSNTLATRAPEKRLFTIDIFDPSFDITACDTGSPMSRLYKQALAGRNQEEIFYEVVKDCKNLTVIKGDSRQVDIPADQICFAYIDGNHEFSYVKSDFMKIWRKLVPNGVVAFDDYAFDIPEVTRAIHEIIGEHAGDIKWICSRKPKKIFIQKA